MRNVLFLSAFLAAASLAAQSKTPDLYQQSNMPPTQKMQQADCYDRRYDSGISALRRGDYRTALRLLESASECPEAQASSRKRRELESSIAFCRQKLGIKAAADEKAAVGTSSPARRSQEPVATGRKFNISPALSKNTDPNCFQLTVREADRAFRDSCWDDAAKLYRAAKNCADANQTDRERMYNRIEACRAAAEDELLQKEQKAVRTARHAIAANLANNAMDLLRQGDRSPAWRLADFANFYIAPDDNPDCLEAMYAAYYFKENEATQRQGLPAFCYQLSQDLTGDIQLRFARFDEGDQLFAFVPEQSRLLRWQLPSMELVSDQRIQFYLQPTNFDLGPDGSILFYGENFFLLPNGQYLELRGTVSKYCISEGGEFFIYLDPNTGQMNVVNLKNNSRPQAQNKGKNVSGMYNMVAPTPVTVASGVTDMAMTKDAWWVGFADSVVVYRIDAETKQISFAMKWNLDRSQTGPISSMKLFPKTREVLVTQEGKTRYYFLHLPAIDTNEVTLVPTWEFADQMLDAAQDADNMFLVNFSTPTPDNPTSDLHFVTIYRDTITDRLVKEKFYPQATSVAVSSDGAWLAYQNSYGQTLIWSMRIGENDHSAYLPGLITCQMSPDGRRLYIPEEKTLLIKDADDPDGENQQSIPIGNSYLLPLGESNHWAVFLNEQNKLTLLNLENNKRREYETIGNIITSFAFDEQESRYIAYSPGNGEVVVKSLTDDSTLAFRDFGEEVTLIRSIPGTDLLLVVTKTSGLTKRQYAVLVWNFSVKEAPPRPLRLQGYEVYDAKVSAQGNRLAVGNYQDIRVFDLNNLDDEAAVIRNNNYTAIECFAFRPDGLAIAYGDERGDVYVYDVSSGSRLLHFAHVRNGFGLPVSRLAFADAGARMRLFSPEFVTTINLDPLSLRDQVQQGSQWLSSFTTDQISRYQLETAFKYPGNFDRLAQSGDKPLIRAFFEFFQSQSLNSNNIEKVHTYCNRALTLFELLDQETRNNLEPTMLSMYKDYVLKRLLRNDPEGAMREVAQMEKRFSRSESIILCAAYASLLGHDLPAASRLFSEHIMALPQNAFFNFSLENIHSELLQFQGYNLLDSAQVTCACREFQQFGMFNILCPPDRPYTPSENSIKVKWYSEIFQTIDSIQYHSIKKYKIDVLVKLLEKSKKLEYPNPRSQAQPYEAAVIALANAYLEAAEFEQLSSPKSRQYLDKAVQLLEKSGPFKTRQDTVRLERLVRAQWQTGRYLLSQDAFDEALTHLNAALGVAKKLAAQYPAGSNRLVFLESEYFSLLYQDICQAQLFKANVSEAHAAYDQAEKYRVTDAKSDLPGLIFLVENKDIDAIISLGGAIQGAEDLGRVLAEIERLAVLMPAQSARFREFGLRIQEAYLGGHPDASPEQTAFWKAIGVTDYYSNKTAWEPALQWTEKALANATFMLQPGQESWLPNWHNLRIRYVYYLLNSRSRDTSALTRAIGYCKEALAWIENDSPFDVLRPFVFSNLAPAYWLRNEPGDRAKAIQAYTVFIQETYTANNNWEVLAKDFLDLHRSGVQWPDLKTLITALEPLGAYFSPEEWRELGY